MTLRIDQKRIDELEKQYPEIAKDILGFEDAILPSCAHCDSEDTATVQVGVVGRTINIALATTKFRLIPNGPKKGKYFCHSCKEFFD